MLGSSRQFVVETVQIGKHVAAALIAIAVGIVSLSYGMASMGVHSLGQLAVEVAQRPERTTQEPADCGSAEALSA